MKDERITFVRFADVTNYDLSVLVPAQTIATKLDHGATLYEVPHTFSITHPAKTARSAARNIKGRPLGVASSDLALSYFGKEHPRE